MTALTMKEKYKLGKLTDEDIAELVETYEKHDELRDDLWELLPQICDSSSAYDLENVLREYE